MHMHDWNTYRQQLLAGVGELGKLSPDTVRGYMTLGQAGAKTGRLDGKMRELAVGERSGITMPTRVTFEGADRFASPKPSPQAAPDLAGQLGVQPVDCLFLGDSDDELRTRLLAGELPSSVYRRNGELYRSSTRPRLHELDDIVSPETFLNRFKTLEHVFDTTTHLKLVETHVAADEALGPAFQGRRAGGLEGRPPRRT